MKGKGKDDIGMLSYKYQTRSHTLYKRERKILLMFCSVAIGQDHIQAVSRRGEDSMSMVIHRYQMGSHTSCKQEKEKGASTCYPVTIGKDHLLAGGGDKENTASTWCSVSIGQDHILPIGRSKASVNMLFSKYQAGSHTSCRQKGRLHQHAYLQASETTYSL